MPGNRASGFLVREDCRRDGWGGCWLGCGGNDGGGSDGGGSAEGGGTHWAACGALISSSSSWDGAAVEVIPLAPRLAAQSAIRPLCSVARYPETGGLLKVVEGIDKRSC